MSDVNPPPTPQLTANEQALARHQRRVQLRKMIEQDQELRRLKIDEIIMRAHVTGMLYVPPTRFKIDRDHVCLRCGGMDEHGAFPDGTPCRPPVGLRRLTVKEIIARNTAPVAPSVPTAQEAVRA